MIYIDLSEVLSSQKNFAEPISFLSKLEDLDLSACKISSTKFPINEFLNLSSLSSLRMSNNDFTFQIPAQLANMTSLSVLDFSNCQLQGSVPYLPQLKELAVSSSTLQLNLTRMCLRLWPRLEILDIGGTSVNGSIPSAISNAPLLVKLLASGCKIQGSLPTSITKLFRLQSLDLSNNNITGYLPVSISNLKHLEFLYMYSNNLQGPIPESICGISSLRKIELRGNNLTGTLPSLKTSSISMLNETPLMVLPHWSL